MALAYTFKDVGCYGDGACGHDHIRARLANLLDGLWEASMEDEYGYNIPESLSAEDVPDDLSDEDDALDVLQKFTESGIVWTFEDGDLVLVAESEMQP